MVCPRCILAVQSVMEKRDVDIVHIQLGEVTTKGNISADELKLLKQDLSALGFELLDDDQQKLIEEIKVIIIEQVHYGNNSGKILFSDLLMQKLHRDYSYLSKLFSATEGVTIEHYTIMQKIEKAKELLSYDQLNLSEIAFRLGYSSVAHLSAQFKKMTGLTPSQFKLQGINLRKPIDNLK